MPKTKDEEVMNLTKEGKEIAELLHKCLDPYLPPIISDSNQSLDIIANTIDAYYIGKFKGLAK